MPFAPAPPTARSQRAANTIRKAWLCSFRKATTHRLINQLFSKGPTSTRVQSITFEQLVEFLRTKTSIQLTKSVLERVHRLCNIRHHYALTPGQPQERVNIRVFLASFMIAYRPDNVFESRGPLENTLLQSSREVVSRFENILRSIDSSPTKAFNSISPDATRDFADVLRKYMNDFTAWKVPDEAKLVKRIKHALQALYQAKRQLPPNEPNDSKLSVEFHAQIHRLRFKLHQIAGAGALAELDTNIQALSLSDGDGGVLEVSNTGISVRSVPTSRMSNEQLAHELRYNMAFQLDMNGTNVESPQAGRVRASFHRAFWRSLEDDLRSGIYVRVLSVLVEIRDGLISVCYASIAVRVAEAVDVSFIKERVDAGAFSWADSVLLAEGIMVLIGLQNRPSRDAETRERWAPIKAAIDGASDSEAQVVSFVSALEFFLDRVNACRIDAANARLNLIAPVVRDHGIDYERGKFADKLASGSVTLDSTRDWLCAPLAKMNFVMDNIEGSQPPNFTPVYLEALLELAFLPEKLTPQTCPATLVMDVGRIVSAQYDCCYITEAATFLVGAGNVLSICTPALQPTCRLLHAALAEVLVTPMAIENASIREAVGTIIADATLEPGMAAQLNRVVDNCVLTTDPVHKIM